MSEKQMDWPTMISFRNDGTLLCCENHFPQSSLSEHYHSKCVWFQIQLSEEYDNRAIINWELSPSMPTCRCYRVRDVSLSLY